MPTLTPDDPAADDVAASRSLTALRRLVDVHPHELRALLFSFAFFFFLLASFSLMRPCCSNSRSRVSEACARPGTTPRPSRPGR